MMEQKINDRKIQLEAELIYAVDSYRYVDESDHVSICSILDRARTAIESGANTNSLHPIFELPIISMAIKNQSIDLIRLLLENRANPNDGGEGIHPMLLAANCYPAAIELLLEHGSDLNHETSEGKIGTLSANMLDSKGLHDQANHIRMMMNSVKNEKDDFDVNEKTHQLFNPEKLQKELTIERNETRLHYLKRLAESGSVRSYRKPNLKSNFDDLYESFPNFSDTLDILSEQTALASLSENSVFTMRPILLVGPPGVGKTRFIKEISKRLNFEFTNISCGGITAGWILSGSSVSWSDGRPGMVHCALRDGTSANPIIMLDEIDKLSGDQRFSGFGPLYQLLDKENSNNFADEAVGIPIDCSKVSWIATANSLDPIPEAITSRFTVIEVDAPTRDQIRSVIKSIYSDILSENKESWGGYFEQEINEDMLSALEDQTPREIVKMIFTAIGRAARSKGSLATGKDYLIKIEASDFKDFKKPSKKYGF